MLGLNRRMLFLLGVFSGIVSPLFAEDVDTGSLIGQIKSYEGCRELIQNPSEENYAFAMEMAGLDPEEAREEWLEAKQENKEKELVSSCLAYQFKKVACHVEMPKSCHTFVQDVGNGACELYSLLAAALRVTRARTKLERMFSQDQLNFYVTFPGKAEQRYRVSKRIYEGDLLPSLDPWVNLFSQAYYEYIKELGYSDLASYPTIIPLGDGRVYSPLFNNEVVVLPLQGARFYLDKNYGIKRGESKVFNFSSTGILEVSDDRGQFHRFDGNRILITVALPGHAVSLFYDREKGDWMLFNNQNESDGYTCGEPNTQSIEGTLSMAYEMRIHIF